MKKFLTVLLVIAVMFTFSFGSAFAAGVDNSADANMIKQAADYVKSTLPEAVQKAYKAVLAGGAANTYITEAAWEAAAEDIVEALSEAIDSARDGYLNTTAPTTAGWNSYDYLYAASKLYPGHTYTELATEFAKNGDASAVMAAKEQFKLDLADALAIYDKVDVAGLYSTTTPKTGKTYYQQAVEAIEASKAVFNDYFIAADGSVKNLAASVSTIQANGEALENAVYNGITLGGNSNTRVLKKMYADAPSVVEYYYLNGIQTKDGEEAADATDAAKAAAAKAAVQAAYASYIADPTQAGFDKTFAANWLTVCTYLAGENVLDSATTAGLLAGMQYADDFAAEKAKYADAIDDVKALEAYAAKCAAETDGNGVAVRDADDIQDIVDEFTLKNYKYAAGLLGTPELLSTYKGKLEVLSINTDDEKLAFDKEAEKADLDDLMYGVTTAAGFVCVYDYYDLEAAAVEAAYEAAKAKVDAAAKTSEFAAIRTALTKELAKIKDGNAVDALFTTGKMATELNKQRDALKSYVTYVNAPKKAWDDSYVLGATVADPHVANLLRDYYIENNARTVAEMQALTGAVEAVVATLPTNADLDAAKKAADDAIKALPSVAATTSADKDAYQNAFDLAKAYNKMVKKATGTAGTTAIPGAKVNALVNAIQNDINLEYAKADKADKAAMKAIAAEVEELNDTVGTTKLFTVAFTDPTVAALAKIRTAESNAVKAAINAIPFTVTEADKATVEKARALYDAYVAEYTDYDNNRNVAGSTADGYVADDFDITAILRAEAALGLNAEDPALSVEALKITASSTVAKGSITIKWTVKGDTAAVEGYEIWKSTKKNSGFSKAYTQVASKNTYKNTKGLKKGTRYYYKVRAIAYDADGNKVKSDWSNKAYRVAK